MDLTKINSSDNVIQPGQQHTIFFILHNTMLIMLLHLYMVQYILDMQYKKIIGGNLILHNGQYGIKESFKICLASIKPHTK